MKKIIALLVLLTFQIGFSYANETDLKILKLLADQGDTESLFTVGMAYSEGLGVEQDYKKAKEYYELAANQGYAATQYNLAVIYESGLGVKQDISTAEEYYDLACDNGYQNGCDAYKELNTQ